MANNSTIDYSVSSKLSSPNRGSVSPNKVRKFVDGIAENIKGQFKRHDRYIEITLNRNNYICEYKYNNSNDDPDGRFNRPAISDSEVCNVCDAKLHGFRLRHHCRNCGKIFILSKIYYLLIYIL